MSVWGILKTTASSKTKSNALPNFVNLLNLLLKIQHFTKLFRGS